MIKSMTGYGRFEAENEEARLIAEIKSVNHRYCDLSIRLPRNLNAFENDIRSQVKQCASRGKIDVYITYESKYQGDSLVKYNRQMAKSYLDYLQNMAEEFELNNSIDAVTLSRFPEVFTLEEEPVDEEKLHELIHKTVAGALEAFVQAREAEGERLKADLLQKLEQLNVVVEAVAKRAPEVFCEYKERLTAKVEELLGDTKLDEGVIATELVIYSDKICIDEELVRLRAHIQQMKDTLEQEDAVGRKLDFIAQELNREANTTLSKANDLILADKGIILKTEIEKIREQIQNLE